MVTKTPIVLRRSAQAISDPIQAAAHLNSLHTFLEDLVGTRFLAPRPMPVLDGKSWLIEGGYRWQAITSLQGRALMWTFRPELEAVGELLARYRLASASCPRCRQRPSYQSLASTLARPLRPDPLNGRGGVMKTGDATYDAWKRCWTAYLSNDWRKSRAVLSMVIRRSTVGCRSASLKLMRVPSCRPFAAHYGAGRTGRNFTASGQVRPV